MKFRLGRAIPVLLGVLLTTASGIALGHNLSGTQVSGVPRIVDGDTVEIAGTKVRLEGMDAPESDQLCLDARGERWACGVSARDALAARYGGKAWTCTVSGTDRYGRSLATCEVNGEDVERWMVRAGWALSFVRYSHTYNGEEAAARADRAGLWSGAFIAPWDWRHRNAQTVILGAGSVPANAQALLLGAVSAEGAPDPSCTIKANTTAAGACIFHEPGDRWYSKMNMASAGKRWFCSPTEAMAAGCRAAPQ